jgi:uncharacterized protein (TIGR02145 family)
MKQRNQLKTFPLSLIIVGICATFFFSCKPDSATLPIISTTTATNITGGTAVSGGTVSDDGGASVTARGICWGTRANPTLDDSISVDGKGVGNYTSNIGNLLPNTTYFVRAYATNAVGTVFGKAISFKTINLPSVSSVTTVSNITGISAVFGGNVLDEGGQPVTSKGVCWSTSINPTINDNKTTDGTGVGNFTSNISDLTPNTTYFVCAYATSSVGTAYGKIIGFSTGKMPKVTTNSTFSKITTASLVCGGVVGSDGGETVLSRGVCWSTNPSPTINDNKTNDGMYVGSFTSTVVGLIGNTNYYIRAYATTVSGVAYGEERTVKTWDPLQTIVDIDGNIYHSVQVGTQLWLVENLNTTKYQNGDLIPTTSPATLDISSRSTPKYQWPYNGNELNSKTYGRLYTYYVATDPRNVAPAGWHVATKAEWVALETYLKSVGYKDSGNGNNGDNANNSITKGLAATTSWTNNIMTNTIGCNLSLNNSTGFNALPGGSRLATGGFYGFLSEGHWWGISDNTSTEISEIILTNHSNYLFNLTAAYALDYGFSIRCVKD